MELGWEKEFKPLRLYSTQPDMSSSVKSILIRTCMGQIQKELTHLEHWLIHLPDDTAAAPLGVTATAATAGPSVADVQASIEGLAKQIEAQQRLLESLVNRLTVLEDMATCPSTEEPWLGDPTPFLPEDDTIYRVHKEDVADAAVPVLVAAVPVPVPLEPVEPVQPIEPVVAVAAVAAVAVPVESVQPVAAVAVPVEPIQPVAAVAVPVAAIAVPVAAVAVPVAAVAVPVTSAVLSEPVEEAEEAEEAEESEEAEEAEEDGVELEEVTYQGTVYYRDPEQFIYSVNEEGEVSEEPIGYWKVKTKSIAFYHKK